MGLQEPPQNEGVGFLPANHPPFVVRLRGGPAVEAALFWSKLQSDLVGIVRGFQRRITMVEQLIEESRAACVAGSQPSSATATPRDYRLNHR